MRTQAITFVLAAVIVDLSGCKTTPTRPSGDAVVRGLSDSELEYLASRLNAHVEALGMSDYRFTSDRWTFNVLAHNDLTRRSKPIASEPVRLLAALPGSKRVLESEVHIARGISLAAVEREFRSFIARIEAAIGGKFEKDFFGRWEPPGPLVPFWASLEESWWSPKDNTKIADSCKWYAKKSDPKILLPLIFEDLKASPSVERTFVYSMLVLHWDRGITLPMLKSYSRSTDQDRGHRKH